MDDISNCLMDDKEIPEAIAKPSDRIDVTHHKAWVYDYLEDEDKMDSDAEANMVAQSAAQAQAAADAEAEREQHDREEELEEETEAEAEYEAAAADENNKHATFAPPPSFKSMSAALNNIRAILKPPWSFAAAKGYTDPGLDIFVREHLEVMKMFMAEYCSRNADKMGTHNRDWSAALLLMAKAYETGPLHAQRLCEWMHTFIQN
jgi:hypothetical protein